MQQPVKASPLSDVARSTAKSSTSERSAVGPTDPHGHAIRQSDNPNAVWCRRPNGVLWRIESCILPCQFKQQVLPRFVLDNFVNYFMSNDDYLKLARRLRQDAKLDFDDGDAQTPQLPEDDAPKEEMVRAMHAYFAYRVKGRTHVYSPIKYIYDRIALRYGVCEKRVTTELYEDALQKMAEWRFGEYFIKNYTVNEYPFDELK